MINHPTVIKVCNGAGCNAWDSLDILRDLPKNLADFLENVKVCEVSCLNSCGGGVSVQLNNDNEKIVKIRMPHQAMDQILPYIASKTQA
jgi:NADH:ubiquinone oxidoreductase subunit E